MLMSLQDISLSFGEKVILQHITATISQKDRIGIVGDNGAGKTSLLRLITKEYNPSSGKLNIAQGAIVGYLAQNAGLSENNSVYEEARSAYHKVLAAMEELQVLEEEMEKALQDKKLLQKHDQLLSYIHAKDGYHMETQIKKVLNGMSFSQKEYSKKVSVLSGGERTRLALAKLLLFAPDILVLDEPTNHLDFDTLNWLETFLKSYKGAIVVVSHDRYFLDQISNRTWEIEYLEMTTYKGNYSAFLPQKEAAVILQQKKHEADVEKAAKLQDYIDRNLVRATTSKMAKSRRKALEKMEITEKPNRWHNKINLQFTFQSTPYEDVLTVKDISVAFDNHILFEQINLRIKRGERLVIAGPNGAGKSTLLKVFTGSIKPLSGKVLLGQGVKYSIFEQQQNLKPIQVIQRIWNQYPRFTELEVRSHLAKFGFRGEDVYKLTSSLSGGELAKLRLAEIVLEKPNLLFLDEPTNHLDIYTREALGTALENYEGTIIVITHDRYLMQSLKCPILYLENKKGILYANYQNLLDHSLSPVSVEKKESEPDVSKNQKEIRRQKAEFRQKQKELEEAIEHLQADILGLENLLDLEEVVTDHVKLIEITEALSDKKFYLDETYSKWITLLENEPI